MTDDLEEVLDFLLSMSADVVGSRLSIKAIKHAVTIDHIINENILVPKIEVPGGLGEAVKYYEEWLKKPEEIGHCGFTLETILQAAQLLAGGEKENV